jgi:hypothetical protein
LKSNNHFGWSEAGDRAFRPDGHHGAGVSRFGNPDRNLGVDCTSQWLNEASMSIIGARKDDWRPGRADVKPAYWIGGFVAAALLYFAVADFVGHFINGDGSPYLS